MSNSEDLSMFSSQDVMSQIVGQSTETLGNDGNTGNDNNDIMYNIQEIDASILQEEISLVSAKVCS